MVAGWRPPQPERHRVRCSLAHHAPPQLALYGLGSIRDDRFVDMVNRNKVTFRRPAVDPDSYFSVFMIHQNRSLRSVPMGSGRRTVEQCLPHFLDFVVWGHEHQCILQPEEIDRPPEDLERAGHGTVVLQPGSSVATSLCDGEAERKHCFILKVRGMDYQLKHVPLRCVRPFRIADVRLDASGINPDAPDVVQLVAKYLTAEVSSMSVCVCVHVRTGGAAMFDGGVHAHTLRSVLPHEEARFGLRLPACCPPPRRLSGC